MEVKRAYLKKPPVEIKTCERTFLAPKSGMHSITERFPPLSLPNLIDGIRRFPLISQDERIAFINKLVQRHPILAVDWQPDWRYRRARVLGPTDSPTSVDDIIWNKSASSRVGRANPAGYPVFYLADRLNTALAETHVKDETVLLGEFKVKPGSHIRIGPVGELLHVHRTGRGWMTDEYNSISSLLNICAREEAEALIITDAFLVSLLTNSAADYVLSAAVAVAIFEKLPALDAISFQSTRCVGGICLALKTEKFWSSWGVFSLKRVRARHLAMGQYEVLDGHHVEGIYNDGRLAWAEEPGRADMTVELSPLWTPT